MSDDKSLVKIENVFGLSEPARELIEKISNAIGILYEPRHIKKLAQAKADAELTETEGQIKINELQQRAMLRFVSEETKKQENIESITSKSIPLIEDSSKPDEIDDDWIVNFFDECRNISDENMQQLWAKILAGEANGPGTYSKRTVDLLGSMGPQDANLFTSLCSFIWSVGDELAPLIYDHKAEIYNHHNIKFSSLSHLDAIGLIRVDFTAGYILSVSGSHRILQANYFDTSIVARKNKHNHKNDFSVEIGHAMLTRSGYELTRICNTKPVNGFVDYVLENWKTQGLKTNIIPKQS